MSPVTDRREQEMTTSVSVPAAKLRDMLAAVIPHACDDDTLPALRAVLFEVGSGWLYAVASDRYTIAAARCEIPGAADSPAPDASALLTLDEAREMDHMLERAEAVAALTISGRDLRMDAGTGCKIGWTLTDDASRFPDWRSLLRGCLAGERAELGDGFGISPVHLAKVARRGPVDDERYCAEPLRMRVLSSPPPGATTPRPMILLARGGWFLAIMTPCRIDREHGIGEPDYSPWADWVAVTAGGEKAEAA